MWERISRVCTAMSVAVACAGATLHVPADFPTIQQALDAASDGDTVLVAPGRYIVTAPLDFNRLHDPAGPAVKNLVVRSAAGAILTTIEMSLSADRPERASVVIFEHGESASSLLAGFTLTGGRGTTYAGPGDTPKNGGGGVLCVNGSSPALAECIVTRNSADYGGGVCAEQGSPSLSECRLAANVALKDGGGLYGSFATIADCAIRGNRAIEHGGGVSVVSGRFLRCVIAVNLADDGGGLHGVPDILENCLVVGNSARVCGEGRFTTSTGPFMLNCTISGNFTGERAASFAYGTLRNCVLWANSPEMSYYQLDACLVNEDPQFVRPAVFDFEKLVPVTIGGMAYNFPDFAVDLGDWRLQDTSPARDAGGLEGAPVTDAAGAGRPCGNGVDIGAYEIGACVPTLLLRGDANADGRFNIADPVRVLVVLFRGGEALECPDAADLNDDGTIDLADAIEGLSYLFTGILDAPAVLRGSMGRCAPDPTQDGLAACRCEQCPEQSEGKAYFFCVDRSGSMGETGADGETKFVTVKREIVRAIQAMSEECVVSVVFFDHWRSPLTYGDPPIRMDPAGKATLTSLITRTYLSSGSCMMYGMERVFELASRTARREPTIILIGDGRTHCEGDELPVSDAFFALMRENVRRIPINTVYVGSTRGDDWDRGKALLELLSRATGGTHTLRV